MPSPALNISASPSASVAAGSSVTLNCCATLGAQMDGSFLMHIIWTGPDGKMLNYTDLTANAVLPSCATISLVVQAVSGVYTCNATVYSSTPSNFILGSIPTIKQQKITSFPGKPQCDNANVCPSVPTFQIYRFLLASHQMTLLALQRHYACW